MINVKTKGASAEREIINLFVGTLVLIENDLKQQGYNVPTHSDKIQRNSLQFAKGGADLHGLPYISVEIKRQETLNINTWWNQCEEQAQRTRTIPVLIYKQSRKEWKVISWVKLSDGGTPEVAQWVRAEYSFKSFIAWYKNMYIKFLLIECENNRAFKERPVVSGKRITKKSIDKPV